VGVGGQGSGRGESDGGWRNRGGDGDFRRAGGGGLDRKEMERERGVRGGVGLFPFALSPSSLFSQGSFTFLSLTLCKRRDVRFRESDGVYYIPRTLSFALSLLPSLFRESMDIFVPVSFYLCMASRPDK
jgi:hypothetical protein